MTAPVTAFLVTAFAVSALLRSFMSASRPQSKPAMIKEIPQPPKAITMIVCHRKPLLVSRMKDPATLTGQFEKGTYNRSKAPRPMAVFKKRKLFLIKLKSKNESTIRNAQRLYGLNYQGTYIW